MIVNELIQKLLPLDPEGIVLLCDKDASVSSNIALDTGPYLWSKTSEITGTLHRPVAYDVLVSNAVNAYILVNWD